MSDRPLDQRIKDLGPRFEALARAAAAEAGELRARFERSGHPLDERAAEAAARKAAHWKAHADDAGRGYLRYHEVPTLTGGTTEHFVPGHGAMVSEAARAAMLNVPTNSGN
jgi:hypothetical protein